MDPGQAVSHTYIEGRETRLRACSDGKTFRSVLARLRLVMELDGNQSRRTVRGGDEASDPKLTGAANGEGNEPFPGLFEVKLLAFEENCPHLAYH